MKAGIIILYILLIAGGLWNALGVLQETMSVLAAPIIIGLGIWVFIETYRQIKTNGNTPRMFVFWALLVVVFTIIVEGIGVHTGMLFGDYSYGEVLQPKIAGVPIAIGFAWLTMLLSSLAVITAVWKTTQTVSALVLSLIVGLVMVAFDAVMEPAAITLGYWQWQGNSVPAYNYVTWFAVSLLLTFAGLWFKALPRTQIRFNIHVFIAQLGYFVLTIVGSVINT